MDDLQVSTSSGSMEQAGEDMISAEEDQSPSQDERTLAALAHASALLNIVSGLGGLVVAFLIWLTQKDRSDYVEDQALQSLVFQAAVVLLTGAAVVLMTVAFASVCLIPVGILLIVGVIGIPLGGIAYSVYAAVLTYQGRQFKYWWLGDAIRGQKRQISV